MGINADKPKADFSIRLVGPNVRPWSVPMRSLSQVLNAVQKLVDQRDDLAYLDEDEAAAVQETPDAQERTLQLLAIKVASAGYAVASKDRHATLAILQQTAKSIENPDDAEWHPSTISSIDDLSHVARQLDCEIEIRDLHARGANGDVIAKISPLTFATVKQRAFIHGHTSVVGRLERVGGAQSVRCGIHVQGRRRMLFCDVAEASIARDLGKLLYSDVVLSGQATWYRFNHQLKSMVVTSFSPAKTTPMKDVLQEIYDAGGKAWDKINDPEAFIREMRQ